jgi:hypothetical protein
MKNLDIGKDVRFIFCDISKALDRVWHHGLLYKLRKYGIKGNLLTWFGSYLSDRKQRVCMNGYYSTWNSINAGIPQGSILGTSSFIYKGGILTSCFLVNSIGLVFEALKLTHQSDAQVLRLFKSEFRDSAFHSDNQQCNKDLCLNTEV